ncbi:MAG: hypothetical protein M1824_001540 [Vezdaea acicularis]|nr:MAG: hypothetical protein M1824_001540 [Vezdaea acicularis]
MAPVPRLNVALEKTPAINRQSILSVFQIGNNENTRPEQLNICSPSRLNYAWYLPWLASQLSALPESIKLLLNEGSDFDTANLLDNRRFSIIFSSVNESLRSSKNTSIDDVIEHLEKKALFKPSLDTLEVLRAKRLLVFAFLGWQSMLFLPSFEDNNLCEFAIRNDPNIPNSGLLFDAYSVSENLADRPLAILLKAYGNLLPARCCSSKTVASELAKTVYSWTSLSPFDTNAYLLHSILRVEIRWVDTLAAHLDYDKSSRTLSLFRYPSFCIAMLQSKGALYAFASTEPDPVDPRATEEEITFFLRETLLSYRLLFGQSKPARRFFRSMLSSESVLSQNPDPLLRSLCLDQYFVDSLVPADRLVYVTVRDFLVLGERVELLAAELRGTKPRSWRDLLRDRRDSLQYWTFWLVAIFGVTSIFLSLMQVILSLLQVLEARHIQTQPPNGS